MVKRGEAVDFTCPASFWNWNSVYSGGMDHSWSSLRWTLSLLLVFHTGSLLSGLPHPGLDRKRPGDKSVVFPSPNATDHHSLPVFPDRVDFLGQQRPLAPPVDKFGHPVCTSQAGDTFCEDVDNYPDTEIRKAINYSMDEFKDLFGSLTINPRKIAPGDLSEETVCPQRSRMFYPKAAVNENDQWAFVVNDVDYVQAVMAEICEKEDKPCMYLDGVLPSGVSSRCKQKFAYKRLLALHPSNKKTYTDAFRFPSCCVCYVKRPFVLSRSRIIKDYDGEPEEP